MSSPGHSADGVRYRLVRGVGGTGARWVYRGSIETAGLSVPLVITVVAAPGSTDGVRTAVAVGENDGWQALPEALRTVLCRTAANMVKVAVRRADTEAVDPPRRIHRWRG